MIKIMLIDPPWYVLHRIKSKIKKLYSFFFHVYSYGVKCNIYLIILLKRYKEEYCNNCLKGTKKCNNKSMFLTDFVRHIKNLILSVKDFKIIVNSDFFDSQWYLFSYSNINNTGFNPAEHYAIFGWRIGLDPGPNFSTNAYLERYNDVRKVRINPLVHYELFGKNENRITTKSCEYIKSNLLWIKPSLTNPYDKWKYRNRLTPRITLFLKELVNNLEIKPKISIIMPVYNTDSSVLEKALESIINQIYPNWELCIVNDGSSDIHVDEIILNYTIIDERIKYVHQKQNGGIVSASNVAWNAATGDYFALMDHDDTLEPDAFIQIVYYLINNPTCDILYSDSDQINIHDKSISWQFKPDWSPELMTSYCYIFHMKIFSKYVVEKVKNFDKNFEGSQDYDFFLRASQYARKIGHLPLVLYHYRIVPGQFSSSITSIESGRKAVEFSLDRKNIDWITVEMPKMAKKLNCGIYQLKPSKKFSDLVSIIINVKDNYSLIHACIKSIEQKSSYISYEIIITDDESSDKKTIEYLRELESKHTVLWLKRENDESFNHSKINNAASKIAKGKFLIFLNADTEVLSRDWIEQMLIFAKMDGIGVVGAKLFFPDKRIQHAGVIVGCFNGLAAHPFKGYHYKSDGYMWYTNVARNYSAVTGACMMISRNLFLDVGGFDDINFPIAYNDVDICLRILERGLRTIYTPYAELIHHEGVFRGKELSGSKCFTEEINFKQRWKDFKDPYYNINLSLDLNSLYSIDSGINTRMKQFNQQNIAMNILSVSYNVNDKAAFLLKISLDRYLSQKLGVNLKVLWPFSQKNDFLEEYFDKNIMVDFIEPKLNLSIIHYEEFREIFVQYLKDNNINIVYAESLNSFWAIDAAHYAGIPSVWTIRENEDPLNYYDNTLSINSIIKIAKEAIIKANRLILPSGQLIDNYSVYDLFGTSKKIYNGINLKNNEKLLKSSKRIVRNDLNIPDSATVILIEDTSNKLQYSQFRKSIDDILVTWDETVIIFKGKEEFISELKPYLLSIFTSNNKYLHIKRIDPDEDIFDYYSICDIFVCVSSHESFPLSILGAMSYSLPIVAHSSSDIIEQITHEINGLLYNPDNIDELFIHINTLYKNKDFAKKMGDNGNKILNGKFEENSIMEEYYQVFREVFFEEINEVK